MNDTKTKALVSVDKLTEIRDAVIGAIKDFNEKLFADYKFTIKIVGKINKTGVTAVFIVEKAEVEKGILLQQLINLIKQKLKEWKNSLEDLIHLESLEFSFGLDLSILGELSITVKMSKKKK